MLNEAEEFSEPVPCNLRRPKIWAFAETVAARQRYKPGSPLEEIVKRLGGRIKFRDIVAGSVRLPESMVVNSFKDFTIYLPIVTSPVRDRFTICHELGHYFLHFPIARKRFPEFPMRATRWVDQSNPVQVRAEWEANWFAASFLMPEEAFTEIYKSYGRARTAVRFDVSEKAVENRAKSLLL